jgi:hypothetical protein
MKREKRKKKREKRKKKKEKRKMKKEKRKMMDRPLNRSIPRTQSPHVSLSHCLTVSWPHTSHVLTFLARENQMM